MKYHRTELKSFSVNTIIRKAVMTMMAFLLFNAFAALAQESTIAKETIDESAVKDVASPSLGKSHKVYFSLADEFGGPKKEAKQRFDCSDQIYTIA